MLFVDSSCSRQGVASLLLGQIERFADAAGIDRLTVHASITARLFFMQCGCLCSMVLRPVERLVFSPKER